MDVDVGNGTVALRQLERLVSKRDVRFTELDYVRTRTGTPLFDGQTMVNPLDG